MPVGRDRRSRSFRVAAFVTVVLSGALIVGSLPVMGAVPLQQSGKRGIWTVKDSQANPGAVCVYNADGGAGNDLDVMEARSPRVLARNRSSARDSQWVGIRLIFQRSVNDGGSGGWQKAKQTNLVKKLARDDQAVGIGKRAWIAEYEGMPHFRVLARINWYKPGSKSKVQGTALVHYQWYEVQHFDPVDAQEDRCLPEP